MHFLYDAKKFLSRRLSSKPELQDRADIWIVTCGDKAEQRDAAEPMHSSWPPRVQGEPPLCDSTHPESLKKTLHLLSHMQVTTCSVGAAHLDSRFWWGLEWGMIRYERRTAQGGSLARLRNGSPAALWDRSIPGLAAKEVLKKTKPLTWEKTDVCLSL